MFSSTLSLILVNLMIVGNSLSEFENEQEHPYQRTFVRSHHSLRVLAFAEKSIYPIIKTHSESLSESQNEITWVLQSYLEDFEDSSGQVVTGMNKFEDIIPSNPILSSIMLERFTLYLPVILQTAKEFPEVNDALEPLERLIQDLIGWPLTPDLEDMWRAILRVVFVYDFGPHLSQFASGRFPGGINTGAQFRAKHCYQLGFFAMTERYFAQAVEWLEYALDLVEAKNDTSIEVEKVRDGLSTVKGTHDREIDLAPTYESTFFLEKIESGISPRVSRRKYHYDLWRGKRETNYNVINFWGLCSGEDLRTEEEKANLYCWLDFKSNPAWYINPLKVEQLSISPYVIQIYDIITDTLSQRLINLSQENLQKSVVSAPEGLQISNTRTAATSWLNDTSPELDIITIPRRIELITNLNILPYEASESLQIASNSFGSHYEVHLDTSNKTQNEMNALYGARIATFMLYLTNVEVGGYTAFTQVGYAARPIKNSGVFWYNLKQNGEIDENTHHGACPVILGDKWVANKWIRSFSQTFKRPCSLDPNE